MAFSLARVETLVPRLDYAQVSIASSDRPGLRSSAGEAGLIWGGLFRHGLSGALPGQSQNQRQDQNQDKTNVKGVGQECPTHMGKVKVKINVKGDRLWWA